MIHLHNLRAANFFSLYFKTPLGVYKTPDYSSLSHQRDLLSITCRRHIMDVLFLYKYLVIHVFGVNSHWYYITGKCYQFHKAYSAQVCESERTQDTSRHSRKSNDSVTHRIQHPNFCGNLIIHTRTCKPLFYEMKHFKTKIQIKNNKCQSSLITITQIGLNVNLNVKLERMCVSMSVMSRRESEQGEWPCDCVYHGSATVSEIFLQSNLRCQPFYERTVYISKYKFEKLCPFFWVFFNFQKYFLLCLFFYHAFKFIFIFVQQQQQQAPLCLERQW